MILVVPLLLVRIIGEGCATDDILESPARTSESERCLHLAPSRAGGSLWAAGVGKSILLAYFFADKPHTQRSADFSAAG